MGHIGDRIIQRLDLKPMPRDEALHEAVPEMSGLTPCVCSCGRCGPAGMHDCGKPACHEAERMTALPAAGAAAVLDDNLDDEAEWVPSSGKITGR